MRPILEAKAMEKLFGDIKESIIFAALALFTSLLSNKLFEVDSEK